MRLTFYGAAQEVGRSCILVESKSAKILLDSGIKLGEKEEHPIIPDELLKSVDALILSHAHLDHCGYIPHLYSRGFAGDIYAIKPTLELVNVIINDYMKISKPKDVTKEGIAAMPKHYKMVEYHKDFKIKDLTIRLLQAGHILGSAMVEVSDGATRLLYTGDMNLKSTRLLDPADTEHLSANVLITESTYGGKKDVFPSERAVLGPMIESMKETINKGGKIIIPSFAVGRGQEVLFLLDNYIRSGVIPKVPIYIDGMISKAMRIYRHNVIYCKDEIQKRILMSEEDPFKSPNFNEVKDKAHRTKIMAEEGAAIIVTTSGMLKGGPVIRYLQKLAGNSNNKLILVGYQAVDTPGRALEDGAREIELGEKKIKVKINLKVETYHLSAHADRPQLIKLMGQISGLRKVFIIHGEANKSNELYEEAKGKYEVHLPKLGESFEI